LLGLLLHPHLHTNWSSGVPSLLTFFRCQLDKQDFKMQTCIQLYIYVCGMIPEKCNTVSRFAERSSIQGYRLVKIYDGNLHSISNYLCIILCDGTNTARASSIRTSTHCGSSGIFSSPLSEEQNICQVYDAVLHSLHVVPLLHSS